MDLGLALLRIPGVRTLSTLLTARRIRVEGDSMAPLYQGGQRYLVDRATYRFDLPKRGDAVVFRHPSAGEKILLKRIIGLPGERVSLREGEILINDQPHEERHCQMEGSREETLDLEWGLGDDEYFVLGDNLSDSLDSRRLGPVKRRWIVGKVWLRYWPLGGGTHTRYI